MEVEQSKSIEYIELNILNILKWFRWSSKVHLFTTLQLGHHKVSYKELTKNT